MTQTPARARDPLAENAPARDPDKLTVEQLTERLVSAIRWRTYNDLCLQLRQAQIEAHRAESAHQGALRVIEAERVENRRLKAKITQVQRRLDTRDAANHRALLDETPTAVLLAELGRRTAELPEADDE